MAIRLNHWIGHVRPPASYAAAISDGQEHAALPLCPRAADLWSCRHQRDADLAGLIAAGRGDTPLVQLRWRCATCGSRRIDMVW
jgi:hypothetical protein